jgi:hypothetical protein
VAARLEREPHGTGRQRIGVPVRPARHCPAWAEAGAYRRGQSLQHRQDVPVRTEPEDRTDDQKSRERLVRERLCHPGIALAILRRDEARLASAVAEPAAKPVHDIVDAAFAQPTGLVVERGQELVARNQRLGLAHKTHEQCPFLPRQPDRRAVVALSDEQVGLENEIVVANRSHGSPKPGCGVPSPDPPRAPLPCDHRQGGGRVNHRFPAGSPRQSLPSNTGARICC